jgi:ABC-type amino acid transport substrate-binding protein
MGAAAQAQTTLERVKQRGHLICGTSTGIAGFSLADGQGNWAGLDVDVCGRSLRRSSTTRPRCVSCRWRARTG